MTDAASNTFTVSDDSGKKFSFYKELKPSQQIDLIRIGARSGITPSEMEYWYNSPNTQAAYRLRAIDDVPWPRPTKAADLDERMDLIGNHGMDLYYAKVQEDAAPSEAKPNQVGDAVKNS